MTINYTNSKLASQYELAKIRAADDKHSEAVDILDKIIEFKPDYKSAHTMKAMSLLKLSKHTEAIASCNEAIKLNPHDIAAHGAKGSCLFILKQYQDAIQCFDEVIRITLNPAASALAYGYKGDCLYALHEYNEAIKALDQSIDLYPYNAESAIRTKGLILEKIRIQEDVWHSNPEPGMTEWFWNCYESTKDYVAYLSCQAAQCIINNPEIIMPLCAWYMGNNNATALIGSIPEIESP